MRAGVGSDWQLFWGVDAKEIMVLVLRTDDGTAYAKWIHMSVSIDGPKVNVPQKVGLLLFRHMSISVGNKVTGPR